ncbi:hypothetical protein V6N11_043891 [Hibiscus sabdariffa]|uniref:Fructose-bisphosphate aldolase n=1 Tax=Hibiscus sabdariffa TaxID=183260 RepID=A0ABR2REB6_9ROSI
MIDGLVEQNIVPGIRVDKGLVPLAGLNSESWCQGLDGLASRSAACYKQGAHFAKWRTVVSIPNGPSELAVKEATWGLACYAAVLSLRTFEVAKKVWAEVFFYLAHNNVLFEGILLKPSMVTPSAECKDRATPKQVATPSVSSSKESLQLCPESWQSEVEATLNLNAMNQAPNPPENVKEAQDMLLVRAKANSLVQLGKYTGEGESEEAKQGMFVKGYVY